MVKNKIITSYRKSKGQDLVEFALTIPILLLIIFGIFDLGRVVYYASALQNAAREGARYGVVNPWATDAVIDRVKSRSLGLNPNDLAVSINWNCPTVEVDVDFYFKPITPLIGMFLPDGDVNITLNSELQRERWLIGDGDPDDGCNPAAY